VRALVRALVALTLGVVIGANFAPLDALPEVVVHDHAIFDVPELRVPEAPPFEVSATAYCPCPICCGKWAKWGLTRIGVRPREGWTIAADPRVFPLRSCVLVDGRKMRVQDTGSAIKGDRIDLFMDAHEAAKAHGVKRLAIEPWVC